MKKQILSEEFKRMQKLAGLIIENVDSEELIDKIEDLKDSDVVYSRDPDKGLAFSLNDEEIDEELLLKQILNLIKKINPNADLGKKKQSLGTKKDLGDLNDDLAWATFNSSSRLKGSKDYFEDHLEMFKEAINSKITKLNLKKNGIYILDGGLNNNDTWDEKSLKSAQVLYYTKDFRDPKLEKYKKDGIVKVEITNDGDIDVVQY